MEVASHHRADGPGAARPARRAGRSGTAARPTIPFLSTVTDPDEEPVLDADYWVANVRKPVRFSQAITAAGADHGTFIEVSPNPLLTYAISDTLGTAHHHSFGTLRATPTTR